LQALVKGELIWVNWIREAAGEAELSGGWSDRGGKIDSCR
jgi:hypothetical protein